MGGEQKPGASKEGLKEIGRLVIIALLSWLLTEGVIDTLLALVGVNLSPETRLVITGVVTTALKGFDKYLHKSDKSIPVVTDVLTMKNV